MVSNMSPFTCNFVSHYTSEVKPGSRGKGDLNADAAAADGDEEDEEDEEEGDDECVEHVRHSGAPKCETVAVVFQRHDDLERWRMSQRRKEW